MKFLMQGRDLSKLPRFLDCRGFTPITIELLISSKCNLRCGMCNVWKFSTENSHRKVSELSTTEVKDFLEEVARLGARFLCLSGGEPALRSDLVEIIQKAKKEGLEVMLITNGTLIKHDLAEKIVKSGLDKIIFSIDSSNPNPHDNMRGVKGCWEKAVQGIKSVNCIRSEYKLKKPKICINYAVTRLNYELIGETIDLSGQLGFDEINFLPVIPKTTRANDLLLTYVDLEKLWSLIPSIKARMKKNKLQTNSLATLAYICRNRETAVQGKYAVPVRSQILCLQPWQMATIDPFGNVYPCCYACMFQNLPDEHIHNLLTEDQFNMGNIKEKAFKDIWNGDRFVWFRTKSKQPLAFEICKACNYSFRRDMLLTGLFSKPSLLLRYINELFRTFYDPTQATYFYS